MAATNTAPIERSIIVVREQRVGREILLHQTGRDEGKRMVVYGAEVCGELFDGAIWFYGVTGDRGAGGTAFQRAVGKSVQRVANHARLDGAVVERELDADSRIKSDPTG
jgi:hypothetical protein